MRIAHVNEHLARKGGVETYLLGLLPLLREESVDAHVLYGSGEAGLWEAATALPAVGHTGFANDAAGSRDTTRALEALSPDIIHLHGIQNLGVIKACLDHAPTVMTSHDYRLVCPASTYFYKRSGTVCTKQCGPTCFTTTLVQHCMTPRPSYAAYYYRRARWVIANASRFSAVVAPCADAQARFSRAGFDPAKISVIPYFCPVVPRQEPRPLPETHTITYVGRLARNKGHDVFLDALGELPSTVHGRMIGNFNDASRAATMERAEALGCADRIELHPWAGPDEIMRMLDDTSALVFPSLWPETLGIVGLEAFSRGVPVVASAIGGVPEWLREGENGYMVTPGSSREISEAVVKLISDADRLEAFGRTALTTISDKFLPGMHVSKLMSVYRAVSSRTPAA